MTEWIGDVFTSDSGWSHLTDLVNLQNRMAGTPGEQEASELTLERLEAVGGRNGRLKSFDIQGWERGRTIIRAGEVRVDGIALPRSPNGRGAGELVDAGYGLPTDFEERDVAGKVVLVSSGIPDWYDRYIHRREKYYRAVDGGASGFIYQNHISGGLAPTGSVGRPDAPIGEIPAVGVSREVGARLSRRVTGEEVTLDIEATITDATSQNVHVEVGPNTEERVLLTSHIDAHDIAEGAIDNGAGTAVLLEITRVLAERESELETRVEVVVYGAEEVGLRGSGTHAALVDLDSVKVILNNDGVARDRTLGLTTHGFPELRGAVNEVSEAFRHPIKINPKMGPHSDHWQFVKWGVPGIQASSDTGETGRGWGHTEADTLDKVEVRDLREQSILLTALMMKLTAQDFEVSHKSHQAVADALTSQGVAEGMKLVGDWPYDDIA